MPYRKITVDGKEFEYVVGKTHVKIKGFPAAKKEEVGKMVAVPEYCECCGEPYSQLYSFHVDTEKLAVKPADVASYIKNAL